MGLMESNLSAAGSHLMEQTPLYDEHKRLAARMAPFAGWEMPIQYKGIIHEHQAVRANAGMFDVSHMGRFEVTGPEAAQLLRYVCTYAVTHLRPGEGHYTAVCQPDGGIIDDIYVFLVAPDRFLVVANAANAQAIRDWLIDHSRRFNADVVDRHRSTAMIAVQGPQAVEICSRSVAGQLEEISKRRCREIDWKGQKLSASRTGYTGEDGFELTVSAELASTLWQELLSAGVEPCGLGARDTLRLEAALLLYGNDIDTGVNPYEAGLEWVVSLDDGLDFIGREALLKVKEAGAQRSMACLRALDRGIMRAGYPILRDGEQVGRVSSGGFSPTLDVSIGMALLPPSLAAEGTKLSVDIRGNPLPVTVVQRPFYKSPSR